MKLNRENIASILSRLSVLLVYGIFFTIQIFYNLEINNTTKATPSFLKANSSSSHYAGASVKKLNDPQKHTKKSFRLNKRFHHECSPGDIFIVEDSFVRFIAIKKLIPPSEELYNSSIPVNSLRGPPASIV